MMLVPTLQKLWKQKEHILKIPLIPLTVARKDIFVFEPGPANKLRGGV